MENAKKQILRINKYIVSKLDLIISSTLLVTIGMIDVMIYRGAFPTLMSISILISHIIIRIRLSQPAERFRYVLFLMIVSVIFTLSKPDYTYRDAFALTKLHYPAVDEDTFRALPTTKQGWDPFQPDILYSFLINEKGTNKAYRIMINPQTGTILNPHNN